MQDEPLQQALLIAKELRDQMSRGIAPGDEMRRLAELIQQAATARSGPESDSAQRIVAALHQTLGLARQGGLVWLEQVLLPELEVLSRRQEANAAYRRRGSLS